MENKDTKNAFVRQVAEQKYEYGFTTDVHTDIIEKGLNEDIVRLISSKKGEPEWMLEFRLKAFRHWQKMEQPTWGHVHLPEIDYQAISYYADPLAKKPSEEKKEESRGLLNWWKYNKKRIKQGKMDQRRIEMLQKLSDMRDEAYIKF